MALILVVDDEPAIVETVCLLLEADGLNAIGAHSGAEAVAKAQESCPDLLFSDIVMPGMNGFELALQIKAHCPHCRLIFFSGYAEVAEMSSGLRERGYEFEVLRKPMLPTLMVEKVRAALNRTTQASTASSGK